MGDWPFQTWWRLIIKKPSCVNNTFIILMIMVTFYIQVAISKKITMVTIETAFVKRAILRRMTMMSKW